MFLDAEGRKLMKYNGPRSAKSFDKALAEVQEFQDLVKKVEGGDTKAATELLIRQLRLEWFGFEEAKMQVEALEKVTSKESKILAQLLVNAEVKSLADGAEGNLTKRRAAGEHFVAMWNEKRVPDNDEQLYSFWSLAADFAEREGDKKLFKKIYEECKDALQRNPMYAGAVKGLEQRLDDFRKK
jgi:hypothetical protein